MLLAGDMGTQRRGFVAIPAIFSMIAFPRRSMIINEDQPSHRHHIALPLYWLLRHQLLWGHSLLTAKMPTWIPGRKVTLTGGRRRPTCLALIHPAWPTGSCSARRFG